ncbi:hypothetical protein BDV98DRAFT_658196 [Pterulicium gracile]|uniref:glutathione transferase n=1 Tax=Pterulicium gracile TaxID=1884261 RepID=A0A5C3Q7N9_9AGAR|nr:hypothetical protein BDV98DRAFT_658196 [Pterula gracilis]
MYLLLKTSKIDPPFALSLYLRHCSQSHSRSRYSVTLYYSFHSLLATFGSTLPPRTLSVSTPRHAPRGHHPPRETDPFHLAPLDFATGQHKSPENLKKHPFGQVPILEDDGFFLCESRAISKYLARKYASQGTPDLVPDSSDLKASAKFDQASSAESFEFEAAVAPILLEGLFAKFKNPAHSLEGQLDGYERNLTKKNYIAGQNITVVDFFHLPHGTMLPFDLGKDPLSNEKRPHVANWWQELKARPPWAALNDGAVSKESCARAVLEYAHILSTSSRERRDGWHEARNIDELDNGRMSGVGRDMGENAQPISCAGSTRTLVAAVTHKAD